MSSPLAILLKYLGPSFWTMVQEVSHEPSTLDIHVPSPAEDLRKVLEWDDFASNSTSSDFITQYVAAGELLALQTITNASNFLKVQNIEIAHLQQTMSLEKVKKHLIEMVDECHKESPLLEEKQGFIVLERGYASIPLPGIDVPFQSRYLWAGVMPFRAYLFPRPIMAQIHLLGNRLGINIVVSLR